MLSTSRLLTQTFLAATTTAICLTNPSAQTEQPIPSTTQIPLSHSTVLSAREHIEKPPQFLVDPFWPKPLPNNWIIGQVAGVDVGPLDHVWILQRPHSLSARELGATQSPPIGNCCVAAPPVLEFDLSGNLISSWGGPGAHYDWPNTEHGIYVDTDGFVWLAGNGPTDRQVLKFTRDGQFVMQIGKPGPEMNSNDQINFGRPADIFVDVFDSEVYVADGYGNRRVAVFDSQTGIYKRHWGAYGERPDDAALPPYDPDADPIREYRSPVHDVAIAHDGLVYVADRTNNRLQVFQKGGEFVTEAFIRPETLGSGSVSGVTLSEDPDQRWLFIPDGTNNVIWILDRTTFEVQDYFGRLGKNAGQFYRLHNLAIDSRGNLYTTEVNVGQRVQKFDRLRN